MVKVWVEHIVPSLGPLLTPSADVSCHGGLSCPMEGNCRTEMTTFLFRWLRTGLDSGQSVSLSGTQWESLTRCLRSSLCPNSGKRGSTISCLGQISTSPRAKACCYLPKDDSVTYKREISTSRSARCSPQDNTGDFKQRLAKSSTIPTLQKRIEHDCARYFLY